MIRVDLKQCQAEISTATFMSLGGQHKFIRCTKIPTVIATERKPGRDGKKGSMSLCNSCCLEMKTRNPGLANIKMISK